MRNLITDSRFPDPYGKNPIVKTVPPSKRSETFSERADDYLINGTYIAPSCLQSLYNIPTTPATSASNKLAVTGYVEEYAEYSDLTVRGRLSC